MAERITMADVAREAGVSQMTVSRVVNNKDEISPVTRQRVLEVIERLSYRPSGIARGLATKRTDTLGLVVPDIANPFFSDVADGVEDKACAEGYNIFLCNTREDPQREMAVLESLEKKRVDGLVLCSSRLSDDELSAALAYHPTAVLVNRQLAEKDVGVVLIDDATGGRMVTEHLLQAGHSSIGFLAGPPASQSGRRRRLGYRAALEAAGLPYNTAWIRHCSARVVGGQEAAKALFADHAGLSALFCYNDLVAVGALQACAELGIRVPDDVAVVGFDDIPLAALVTPALTTCRVPRYELGFRAMQLLLARIDNPSQGMEEAVLQPELVVRASAP